MLTRAAAVTVILMGLLVVSCPSSPAHAQGKDKGQDKEKAEPPEKELAPRLLTLEEKDIPLTSALAELAKQTGNRVEDRRKERDDPRLKLELKRATFWQALDAIAKEADARVSLYERDGKLALVDGPYQALPASYNGLFRIGIKRMDMIHILDPEAHYCNVHLEIAWEPRFQPFMVQTQPEALEVKDDKGVALDPASGQQQGRREDEQASVGKRNAVELEMRVPAPKRSSATFGALKGSLAVVGPTKMLTFTFDKLAKIEKRADILKKESPEGVTCRLRKFLLEGGEGDALWTAEVEVEYPADGPRFESFQSWMVNNEIYLERPRAGGVQRLSYNGGYETDEIQDNIARLTYRFTDEPEKKVLLGKPEDWKLVYRAPGRIVELTVPFEFKDLPLP
jgi:hypothetical protein